MRTTEYRERIATLSGLVGVLEMLEDRAEGYMGVTEDGDMKEPEYGDWGYELYKGTTEAIRILEKELQKRMQ